jgi:hypothetical protein
MKSRTVFIKALQGGFLVEDSALNYPADGAAVHTDIVLALQDAAGRLGWPIVYKRVEEPVAPDAAPLPDVEPAP